MNGHEYTYIPTYMHAHTHTYTHTQTDTYIHAHIHVHPYIHSDTYTAAPADPARRYEAGLSVHVATQWIKHFKHMKTHEHRCLHHRSAKSIWTRCLCQRSRLQSFTCLTCLDIAFHRWFVFSGKPIRHKRREENQEPKGRDRDPATLSSCLFPHCLR